MSLHADVTVRQGGFVLSARLDVGAEEVVAVVGPNGAGKTTLLLALAGLVPVERGRVVVGGRVLTDVAGGVAAVRVPPDRRRVGHVFQDDTLFPQLDVRDNVAFGPRAGGAGRAAARRAADVWLERLDLVALARARPTTLSGGQRQRVALARALAAGPAALLLDEPLAALDAGARLAVRGELRRHLAGTGVPTVVVTHDPVDALVLADRVVVLEGGAVVQQGSAEEVLRAPRTDYVARLVGLNRWEGRGSGDGEVTLPGGGRLSVAHAPAGDVLVTCPPAAVAVFAARPIGASVRNVWSATVGSLEPRGGTVRVAAVDAAGHETVAEVTALAVADLDLRPGTPVWLAVKATELTVHPV